MKAVAARLPIISTRYGAIAKRLCSGLQSRLGRFDSGSRLQVSKEKP
jgi:hypothetical protein